MRQLPEDQQVPFLHDTLQTMVLAIVEHVDLVRINVDRANHFRVNFTVYVAQSDMGMVLGPEGIVADSIREVVYAACRKTRLKVNIDVLCNGTASSSETRERDLGR